MASYRLSVFLRCTKVDLAGRLSKHPLHTVVWKTRTPVALPPGHCFSNLPTNKRASSEALDGLCLAVCRLCEEVIKNPLRDYSLNQETHLWTFRMPRGARRKETSVTQQIALTWYKVHHTNVLQPPWRAVRGDGRLFVFAWRKTVTKSASLPVLGHQVVPNAILCQEREPIPAWFESETKAASSGNMCSTSKSPFSR